MRGRPNRLQHDDFHPSNLVVAYFSRNDSIPFSVGQIDGYFSGKIPEQFWRLYCLNNALIMLPTISWTLKVVPLQLEPMLDRIRIVLEDHKNFEHVIPSWHRP